MDKSTLIELKELIAKRDAVKAPKPEDTPAKPWYKSKTFIAGVAIIGLSLSEAITKGASWRELVGMALGLAVVLFRKMAWTRLGLK